MLSIGTMFSYALLGLLAAPSLVLAHFQLQFPAPRGPFVEDDEPNFCDGYSTAAENRTLFPLTGGFFTLNSEHTTWTTGVLLSNDSAPTSFDDFSQVLPFFQTEGEGIFCIPLDFSKTNATVKDGENVTIQIVFDGGDGQLYQCADLTLSSNATIPSSVVCSNATSSPTTQANSTGGAGDSGNDDSGAQGITVSWRLSLGTFVLGLLTMGMSAI